MEKCWFAQTSPLPPKVYGLYIRENVDIMDGPLFAPYTLLVNHFELPV